MLERFATGASTYAPNIDHLIFLIAVLVGFLADRCRSGAFLADVPDSAAGTATLRSTLPAKKST